MKRENFIKNKERKLHKEIFIMNELRKLYIERAEIPSISRSLNYSDAWKKSLRRNPEKGSSPRV